MCGAEDLAARREKEKGAACQVTARCATRERSLTSKALTQGFKVLLRVALSSGPALLSVRVSSKKRYSE